MLSRARFFISACLIAGFGFGLVGCATGSPAEQQSFHVEEVAPLEAETEKSDRLNSNEAISPVLGTRYRMYRIDLEDGQVFRAVIESSEFEPIASLFGPGEQFLVTSRSESDDDQSQQQQGDGYGLGALGGMGGGPPSGGTGPAYDDTSDSDAGRASVIASVTEPGEHLLVISSKATDESGTFHIETGLVDNADAALGSDLPTSVTGYLYPGLPLDPDTSSASNKYEFSLDETTLLDIGLNTRDFPGYVAIRRPDSGEVVASSRNPGQEDFVSQLEPGTYELSVSATTGNPVGEYTLSVATNDAQVSESFVFGEAYNGFMPSSRTAIPQATRSGQPLTFEIEEPGMLTATMRSEPVDPYLVLIDGSGNLVTEDDDSAGSLNAEISWPVEPGEYTLWASTYSSGSQGTYTVETSVDEMPEFEEELSVNSEIQGMLRPDDDIYPARNTYITYYDLEIDEATDLRIDLTSENFDTYLILEDDTGRVIAENDDNPDMGSLNSRIDTRVPAGSYRVGVTTYVADDVGIFTLSVQTADPATRTHNSPDEQLPSRSHALNVEEFDLEAESAGK